MNKHRFLAVVCALAMLSLPVAAQAAQPPPCENNVQAPCVESPNPSTVLAPPGSHVPAVHALTSAELQYHHETVAHMAQWAATGPAIKVHPLTEAELRYHRDTVQHMNLR